jgi:murein DD-endopeptidase MepM/ murein hydrolase activator NlpD
MGALAAMAALVAVGIALIVKSGPETPAHAPTSTPAAVALTSADTPPVAKDVKVETGDASSPGHGAGEETKPRPPPVWRVSSMKSDTNVDVVEGTFGKKGFTGALAQAGVMKNEINRVAHALEGVKRTEHPASTDAFVVAKEKKSGNVLAFEYASSPLEVWQARLDEASADKRFLTRKLDLFVEHKRVASSLVISADLPKAIAAAGLRPEIVDAVDDALEGHIDPGAIHAGTRMRVVATEDWVEGTFVRVQVDAIEFVPKTGNALRVYFYERAPDTGGNARRAPAPGFYDAKGRQPYRGAFRSPLPLARVTSRFNPKRMHPVLKVVMPHNGVDFGASAGTPVYSSAPGTVITAGNGGPCGNMVEIDHGSGVTTAYCHLSRFEKGLHAGQKVEARQLIGYVGQTGRATGPHLHFGVKKNGNFIDPLALKLDGVRVLPPSDRDAFAKKRSDLDAIIDGIALPSAADVPDEPEDKDLHGDPAPATSAGGAASAAPGGD